MNNIWDIYFYNFILLTLKCSSPNIYFVFYIKMWEKQVFYQCTGVSNCRIFCNQSLNSTNMGKHITYSLFPFGKGMCWSRLFFLPEITRQEFQFDMRRRFFAVIFTVSSIYFYGVNYYVLFIITYNMDFY